MTRRDGVAALFAVLAVLDLGGGVALWANNGTASDYFLGAARSATFAALMKWA